MTPSTDAVRGVLRSLAEARDGPFSRLWVDACHIWRAPSPEIGFRIFQVADSADAYVAVGVSGTRTDGREVSWSLTVRASPTSLTISAQVEVEIDRGFETVFEVAETTGAVDEATMLIAEYADKVCRERLHLTND